MLAGHVAIAAWSISNDMYLVHGARVSIMDSVVLGLGVSATRVLAAGTVFGFRQNFPLEDCYIGIHRWCWG
jgi:hypothetical protein